MRRYFFCAVLVALGACAGSPEQGRDLALTCQTTECECAPVPLPLFGKVETGPVLWRDHGEAYCPEGQALRRSNYKSEFLKKYGG